MKERSRLQLKKALFERKGARISSDFRPGMHAVVTPSLSTAQGFLECASGAQAPLWGRLRFNQKKPYKTPHLRTKIGSLFPREPAFQKNESVARYIQRVQTLRGGDDAKANVNELPLVGELLDRPLPTLDAKERRRLALALALSVENPEGLFLYDPLADLSPTETRLVLSKLEHHAENEVVVVTVCPNRRVASRLSRRIQTWGGPGTRTPRSVAYSILCDDPARLAPLFLAEESIDEVRVDPDKSRELIVTVEEEEEGAQAIARCLAKAPTPVLQLSRLGAQLSPREQIAPNFASDEAPSDNTPTEEDLPDSRSLKTASDSEDDSEDRE